MTGAAHLRTSAFLATSSASSPFRISSASSTMASAGASRVDLDRWTDAQRADIARARRALEYPEGAWIAARLTRALR